MLFMTYWDIRQRLEAVIADVQDTISARARTDAGAFIVLCKVCGAPTENGFHCTKCERDNPYLNAS